MSDIVDQAVRSKMMARVKSKNTKPELAIRSALHRLGYRFRIHKKELPGCPDLVFPKYHAVVFVNGCFWHGHSCSLFKWPKSRPDFWRKKITQNRKRDRSNSNKLLATGWRVCTVWECSVKKGSQADFTLVIDNLVQWLLGSEPVKDISTSEANAPKLTHESSSK